MHSPPIYTIRVRGHLQRYWVESFAPLLVRHIEESDSEIVGRFDQAALRGILTHLSDLGVVLVSVNPSSMDDAVER